MPEEKSKIIALFKEIQSGNKAAFDEVFFLYHDRLLAFAKQYTRQVESAEELTSELFVKIWLKRNDLSKITNPEVYLYVSIKNACLNLIRTDTKRNKVFTPWPDEPSFEGDLAQHSVKFEYLLDELSFWQGNPFLKPQLSHRALLQYVYKSNTILGLSYTHTDNFSVEVTDTVDQTKIVMVPRNLGVHQHLALTLTQTLSPYKWWNITFNGTLFGLYNKIDFGADRKLDLKQIAGRVSLQQTFKLPYKLNGEITSFYNSKRLAGANQFANPTSQVDLGLQRNFMDNKASLRLVFSDIYKGSRANSVQCVAGLYINNYSYFETQQVKLNFSYRFASGNNKVPRSRSSALENENGRIK